ncbi:peroxidase skpo-1-like isoform X2 [Wyeomyia smithii]|uniref:peroxidase skpo-1-like isoform X2 n=1 Tax=Wyeomyia smithii TaxID=174621 RepID=UPI002467CE89|nr:peroxidase skpo-1-like isoform X2 [Wyeomyia smithii]
MSAGFKCLQFPEFPVHYDKYQKQCGIPVRCEMDTSCPRICDRSQVESWAQAQAALEVEENCALFDKQSFLIGSDEFDYGIFATSGLNEDEKIGVQNTITTENFLQRLSSQSKCAVRNYLEGRCYNLNTSLSLEQCHQGKLYKCDSAYPFRSYNGVCNNLGYATWGQAGNPLKLEIAPCFDDFVSKRRLGCNGQALPNNRQLMVDVQQAMRRDLEPPFHILNMFQVIFSEFVHSDLIGRAIKRSCERTKGFRGCRADGTSESRYKSSLASTIQVLYNDSNYGPQNIECLNFSPIENANDQCRTTYTTKRNTATSYLDLSIIYSDGKYDDCGKLKPYYCQSSEHVTEHNTNSIQFSAIAGLFTQLHNDCVERMQACQQKRSVDDITERCRSLTIAIYQKIIYEELLLALFGDDFYEQCNFESEYDPNLESAVSSMYINGPGRFQHIWIPEQLTYQGKQHPFFIFFYDLERFECNSVIDGMFDDPIFINGLSDQMMNVIFSKNGVRGHCLACLDLERGRDAGVCSFLSYKHYIDGIRNADSRKCYNSFDDLQDIFEPKLVEVLRKHFSSPFDIDMMFAILAYDRLKGTLLPSTVAWATCLEFKRLKSSDRFFYSWNKFLSYAAEELIATIDLKTLLALYAGIDTVPVFPFVTNSERVSAQDLRDAVKSKESAFCYL